MSTFHTAGENQAIITLTEAGHTETTNIYNNMRKRFSRLIVGFAVAQILIGILCFIINGVTLGNLVHYFSLSVTGTGFLTGVTVGLIKVWPIRRQFKNKTSKVIYLTTVKQLSNGLMAN